MKRLVIGVMGIAGMAACTSNPEVSDAELRINEIANASSRDAPFPVLGPLPSRAEVVGEGISDDNAKELRVAAATLVSLQRDTAQLRPSLSTAQTVLELQALVEQLRAGRSPSRAAAVDVEALGFPTPPPLD